MVLVKFNYGFSNGRHVEARADVKSLENRFAVKLALPQLNGRTVFSLNPHADIRPMLGRVLKVALGS